MIDFGLLALFAVILALVFLAFHAWRGIKSDGERIQVFRADLVRDVGVLRGEIQQALLIGNDAKALALEVQGTHYKQLLRRIDEAAAAADAAAKIVDGLVSRTATLNGRVTAIQRWMKAPNEPEPEPTVVDDLPMFPAASMPPQGNAQVNGHFGRMARKGG